MCPPTSGKLKAVTIKMLINMHLLLLFCFRLRFSGIRETLFFFCLHLLYNKPFAFLTCYGSDHAIFRTVMINYKDWLEYGLSQGASVVKM